MLVTFRVKNIVSFCVKKLLHFALKSCYILRQKLSHFALILHFASIVHCIILQRNTPHKRMEKSDSQCETRSCSWKGCCPNGLMKPYEMNRIRSGLWKSDVFVKDKENVDAAFRILQDEVRQEYT